MVTDEKETTRCAFCELRQYRTVSNNCRRCGKPLKQGTVESTTVIYVPVRDKEVRPLRDTMRIVAADATGQLGVMKAAKKLRISPNRLKALLRERGDNTDYRKDRKARREGRA